MRMLWKDSAGRMLVVRNDSNIETNELMFSFTGLPSGQVVSFQGTLPQPPAEPDSGTMTMARGSQSISYTDSSRKTQSVRDQAVSLLSGAPQEFRDALEVVSQPLQPAEARRGL